MRGRIVTGWWRISGWRSAWWRMAFVDLFFTCILSAFRLLLVTLFGLLFLVGFFFFSFVTHADVSNFQNSNTTSSDEIE
jgi:hypothetical protein